MSLIHWELLANLSMMGRNGGLLVGIPSARTEKAAAFKASYMKLVSIHETRRCGNLQ